MGVPVAVSTVTEHFFTLAKAVCAEIMRSAGTEPLGLQAALELIVGMIPITRPSLIEG